MSVAMTPLPEKKTVLCAVYTRKSTDENLNSDFTSLDSQREYCEAFIKSRGGEGWLPTSERYDDPGYSGGNMDRPAMQRLLADAREKKFQVVVAYKYDRLTRNTKDFINILETFGKCGVAFVSVTQAIDTSSSMGRLMQSILIDFAQFEREIISERTRDKMSAMAKKGKRIGGGPLWGYDIDYENKRMVVNETEALGVKRMFETYLKEKSLSVTANILNNEGLHMKRWVTKKGDTKGGGTFYKSNLSFLLQNPFYIGKIHYRGVLYDGEHKAIIEDALFQDVQKLLRKNNEKNKSPIQDKHDFLLKGLVKCATCGSFMTPSFGYSRNGKPYCYYKCTSVNRLDKSACPVGSVPAKALEQFVIERLERICKDPGLAEDLIAKTESLANIDLPVKREEKSRVSAELGKIEAEGKNWTIILGQEGPESPQRGFMMERLAELTQKRADIKTRLMQLDIDIMNLEAKECDAQIVRSSLQQFLEFFQKMGPKEQKGFIQLLIKEVIYDGQKAELVIGFFVVDAFKWQMEACVPCFDEGTKTLPGSDSRQSTPNARNALCLWDKFDFGPIFESRGRLRLVRRKAFELHQILRASKKPVPKPPAIQMLLTKAYDLQKTLATTPGLTRFALAKRMKVDPTRVSQILNLLHLAPRIQAYIQALEPTIHQPTISDRDWNRLARLRDPFDQIKSFEALLCHPTVAISKQHERMAV